MNTSTRSRIDTICIIERTMVVQISMHRLIRTYIVCKTKQVSHDVAHILNAWLPFDSIRGQLFLFVTLTDTKFGNIV